MNLKKTAREVGILLGLAVACALTVNFFSPVGIALMGQWDASRGVVSAGAKNGVVDSGHAIKSLKLAKQIYDRQKTLFVDARTREQYTAGHIKGAISFPVGRFDEAVEKFVERYPPDTPIVTYCSGRTCEDSHRLALLLQRVGFTHIKVLIDGFPAWKTKGYPID